jgi:hypothetical protein
VAQVNAEVRHLLTVKLANGTAVTGLTAGSFTITLRKRSGSLLVAADETVTVLEISAGNYWVYYTPTAVTLYVLSLVPTNALNLTQPDEAFQDDVQAGTNATGSYLTTRSAVKAAFNIAGATHDAQIDALLPQVTDQFHTYCGRNFIEATVTEYPTPLSSCATMLMPNRVPITAVTSLHWSSAIPRVYDSTTLLVEGTDFFISEEGHWIEFVAPKSWSQSATKVAKLVYTGGYAAIPGDIERAAQEVIGVKLMKADGKLYHFAGVQQADGNMTGLRWDDITPNALAVLDSYRIRAIV